MATDQLDEHGFQDFRVFDLLETATVQTFFYFFREAFRKFSLAVQGGDGPAVGFVRDSYRTVFPVAPKLFPAERIDGHGIRSFSIDIQAFRK
jgi:hypothetical protein